MASFPELRLRRLRSTPATRSLLKEIRVHPHDLVAPLFVVEGRAICRAIPSLPGHFHLSVDRLAAEAAALFKLGVPGVLLFGVPNPKDKTEDARRASAPDGIVQRAVAELKRRVPGLVVFTDVCLCEYTSHGHCGLLGVSRPSSRRSTGKDAVLDEMGRMADTLPMSRRSRGALDIANDPTLEVLARIAVSHAEAGADWVAPSDMMDGRVTALRHALDEAGHQRVGILSYAAKSASAFYGPFRDAAASAPAFGDRKGHQMDPANAREALREMAMDIAEGADMLMVKPALPCLDILRQARDRFQVPLAAYSVSGEYSMVHAAAQRGWGDLEALRDESLTAIKRAGADVVVTYWARSFAEAFKKRGGLD
ncbi:MAG: porphobilinogen synthase [bacterium]